MKTLLNKYLFLGIAALALSLGFTSCTDYLDKEPDSDVDDEAAFKNFTNFQGFVELNYNCVPNKESNNWCCTFNWGEDEIINTSDLGLGHLTRSIDLGAYRDWYGYPGSQTYLHGDNIDPTSDDKYKHSLEHAWYCIRHCNLGIANLDKMSGNQDEKNAVAGQLYFFRAWWHFEQMMYWGGIPYIDKVLSGSDEDMTLPRLSFRECAEKCAADFRKAADLLPNDWDKSAAGQRTKGHNDILITKVCALGYLAKVQLWAASPFNVHGASTGANNYTLTYQYDKELAAKAAAAAKEAITEVKSGKTPYALAEYIYTDIYDHKQDKTASTTCFSDIFYTQGQNWLMPGSCEAIMRGTKWDANGSNWNFTKLWGPKVNGIVEHDNVIHQPTANYVNYAYGMENGEPAYIIENGKLVPNTAGGFDPTHPFKNRDPRFYHDIMFDGFEFVDGDPDAVDAPYKYLPLQSANGSDPKSEMMRDPVVGSRTGYFTQKLVPHNANKYDKGYDNVLNTYLPYMRLADIYLMYAEACAASGQAAEAVSAINVLRDRVGAGHVAAAYQSGNALMDEVRRERACELAFEGFRWNDLQRWLLLSEAPYNQKTSQEFRRVGDYDYKKNDPRDAEVTGWHEEVILTRNFSKQHYLFPFKDADVQLYEGFNQNPGW